MRAALKSDELFGPSGRGLAGLAVPTIFHKPAFSAVPTVAKRWEARPCRRLGGGEGPGRTRINQLWVADITYMRLEWEFVYQSVFLIARCVLCLCLADRTEQGRESSSG
jgi:hypothetical protein